MYLSLHQPCSTSALIVNSYLTQWLLHTVFYSSWFPVDAGPAVIQIWFLLYYLYLKQLNSLGWILHQKRSSSFKNRRILASYNNCLFQSQPPESKTERCPAFVLSLAGHRLAMLALAMWLCASASRVVQCGKSECSNGWFFLSINNQMSK